VAEEDSGIRTDVVALMGGGGGGGLLKVAVGAGNGPHERGQGRHGLPCLTVGPLIFEVVGGGPGGLHGILEGAVELVECLVEVARLDLQTGVDSAAFSHPFCKPDEGWIVDVAYAFLGPFPPPLGG